MLGLEFRHQRASRDNTQLLYNTGPLPTSVTRKKEVIRPKPGKWSLQKILQSWALHRNMKEGCGVVWFTQDDKYGRWSSQDSNTESHFPKHFPPGLLLLNSKWFLILSQQPHNTNYPSLVAWDQRSPEQSFWCYNWDSWQPYTMDKDQGKNIINPKGLCDIGWELANIGRQKVIQLEFFPTFPWFYYVSICYLPQ